MKKILLMSMTLATIIGFAFSAERYEYRSENIRRYYRDEISERYYLYQRDGNSRAYVRITGDQAYLEIDGYSLTGLRRVSSDVYQTPDRTVRLEIKKIGSLVKAYIKDFGREEVYTNEKNYWIRYEENDIIDDDYDKYRFEPQTHLNRFVGNYISSYDGAKLLVITTDNGAFLRLEGEELFDLKRKYGRTYENKNARLTLTNNKAYLSIIGRDMEFNLIHSKSEDFAK